MTFAAFLALAAPASASEESWTRSLTLTGNIGAGYDSSVSAIDIDRAIEQSDEALTWGGGLRAVARKRGSTMLAAGLSHGETQQNEVDALDQATTRVTLEARQPLGATTFGISGIAADSELDGQEFYRLRRLGADASRYTLERRLYLRGALTRTEKQFPGQRDRDADAIGGELGAWYFLRGLDRYVRLSLRATREDARRETLDHQRARVSLAFTQRFPFGEDRIRLRLHARYEHRDYHRTDPAIGGPRDDRRTRIGANVSIPLGPALRTELALQHEIFDSNLPAADFSQTTASVRVVYERRWDRS